MRLLLSYFQNFLGALLVLTICSLASSNIAAQDNSSDFYESAVTYLSKGDFNAAIIELKNALQQNPRHLPSRTLLGEVHLRMGKGAAAEKEFTIALDLGAAKDQIYHALGNAYLIQRKYQAILDNIDITTPQYRNRVELITLHGRAHFELAQYREAREFFDRGILIDPRAVGALLGKAALLMSEDNLAGAEQLIDRARDVAPNHVEAWYQKGQVRSAYKDNENALIAYNKVLELTPAHARARLARSELYLRMSRLQEAKADVSIVRHNHPLDAGAALLSYRIHAGLGNTKQGRQDLEAAANILDKVNPDFVAKQPSLIRTAALIHLMSGDFRQSKAYLTKLLILQPKDRDARILLARVKLQLGETDTAIKMLYSAYSLNNQDAEVLYLLGDALLQVGRYAQASIMLEEAASLEPNAVAISNSLALGKLGLSSIDEAIKELEKAAESNSRESISASVILTSIKIKQGEPEEALEIASAMTARYPKNPLFYNLTGVVYLSMQKPAPAREAFEAALEKVPDFLPAIYNLAMIDFKQGNISSAEARYKTILTEHPSALDAMLGLAELYTNQRQSRDAISWLIKANSAHPDSVEPRKRLITMYLAIGELEKALIEATSMKEIYPENPDALELFARTRLVSGEKSEAIANYRNAAKHASFSGDQLLRIARDQISLGDYSGATLALEKASLTTVANRASEMLVRLKIHLGHAGNARIHAEKVLKAHPDQALGYNLLGEIAVVQNQLPDALSYYQTGLNKEENSTSVLGLYKVHMVLSSEKKAFSVMEEWLAKNPKDNLVRRNLAIGYLSSGKKKLAQKEFEQLVENGDQGAVVMSSLASIYHENNDPRALKFAQQALKNNSEWPVALDTYGWILVAEGNVEEGLKYLREAVSRDSNPLMRYHLAVALVKLGRTSEAKIELQTILRSGSNKPDLDIAKKLYDHLNGQ